MAAYPFMARALSLAVELVLDVKGLTLKYSVNFLAILGSPNGVITASLLSVSSLYSYSIDEGWEWRNAMMSLTHNQGLCLFVLPA